MQYHYDGAHDLSIEFIAELQSFLSDLLLTFL
jgi:hypothetical protein